MLFNWKLFKTFSWNNVMFFFYFYSLFFLLVNMFVHFKYLIYKFKTLLIISI